MNDIYKLFEEKTGQKLKKECNAYIAEYSYGGMSSGQVCGSFCIVFLIYSM